MCRIVVGLVFWLAIGAFGIFVLVTNYRIDAVRLRELSSGQSDIIAVGLLVTAAWASAAWGRRLHSALRDQ